MISQVKVEKKKKKNKKKPYFHAVFLCKEKKKGGGGFQKFQIPKTSIGVFVRSRLSSTCEKREREREEREKEREIKRLIDVNIR